MKRNFKMGENKKERKIGMTIIWGIPCRLVSFGRTEKTLKFCKTLKNLKGEKFEIR